MPCWVWRNGSFGFGLRRRHWHIRSCSCATSCSTEGWPTWSRSWVPSHPKSSGRHWIRLLPGCSRREAGASGTCGAADGQPHRCRLENYHRLSFVLTRRTAPPAKTTAAKYQNRQHGDSLRPGAAPFTGACDRADWRAEPAATAASPELMLEGWAHFWYKNV